MHRDEHTLHQPNRLGYEPVGKLLVEFTVPTVVSMVINTLYVMVDQIWVGRGVGWIGLGAVNIFAPLNPFIFAVAVWLGVGCATNFSLSLGRGRTERAARFVGTALTLQIALGLALLVGLQIFLRPLLHLLGGTPELMPGAITYGRIYLLGTPFVLLGNGQTHITRADGAPRYTMMISLGSAALNLVLDPIFIFPWGLDMGVAGAAWATVISQAFYALGLLARLARLQSVSLSWRHLKVRLAYLKAILTLGASSLFNQLTFSLLAAVTNVAVARWGAHTPYGSNVALAAVGSMSRYNQLCMSFVIGMANGAQPLVGFNWGAGKLDRVAKSHKLSLIGAVTCCLIFTACCQLWAEPMARLFNADEPYVVMGAKYLRIALLCAPLMGFNSACRIFFQATGRPLKSITLVFCQRLLCFIPLVMILPPLLGFVGILWATPLAEGVGALITLALITPDWRRMARYVKMR